MRISDWSSDVCSSDLGEPVLVESWSTAGIPSEVQISTDAGERWLGCSTAVGGGGGTLVVVARDVTRAREVDRMKADLISTVRSEERRVGKECVSTCRSRWSPYH